MRLHIVLNPVLLNSLWRLHISKLSHAAAVYLIGLVHICKWERLWWASLAKLIVRLIVSDWILCCILPAPRANEASRHFNNLIETVENIFPFIAKLCPRPNPPNIYLRRKPMTKDIGLKFCPILPNWQMRVGMRLSPPARGWRRGSNDMEPL